MHIYIISSDELRDDLFKIGKTRLTKEKLLMCYSRGLPNAEILEFYTSLNHSKDERNLLKMLKNYRYINGNGNLTEWLNIDFCDLKEILDEYFAEGGAKADEIVDIKKVYIKKEDINLELQHMKDKTGYSISIEAVFKILNRGDLLYKYKYEQRARDHVNKSLRENLTESKNETDLTKDFIIRKTETKVKFPWFTLNGFRALAATYKCEEATIIRNFYF
jgi:hypothetical protein